MREPRQLTPDNYYAGESRRGDLGGGATDVDGGERGGNAVRCDDVSDQPRQRRKHGGDVHDDVRDAECVRDIQRKRRSAAR